MFFRYLPLAITLMLQPCLGANTPGKPLVVLSPPSPSERYYQEVYGDIINFMVTYAKRIIDAGNDNVIVLGDRSTLNTIGNQLPAGHVLAAENADIWVRDFGPSIMVEPILFKYQPDYLDRSEAREIQNAFVESLQQYGVTPYVARSNLVLDGGNVVDNGVDTMIVTSRAQKDNPGVDIKQALRRETEYPNIVVIDALRGDTTGHSDGMVSWVDTNTLAMGELDPGDQQRILGQLRSQLPNKRIEVIPSRYKDEVWKGFGSACGLHVNSLVTDRTVYVPAFGGDPTNQQNGRNLTPAWDQQILRQIQGMTSKKVVAIPVSYNICKMGGSVRCLSWQVKGNIADQLVKAANNQQGGNNGGFQGGRNGGNFNGRQNNNNGGFRGGRSRNGQFGRNSGSGGFNGGFNRNFRNRFQ